MSKVTFQYISIKKYHTAKQVILLVRFMNHYIIQEKIKTTVMRYFYYIAFLLQNNKKQQL
jgi:hypothetical protein